MLPPLRCRDVRRVQRLIRLGYWDADSAVWYLACRCQSRAQAAWCGVLLAAFWAWDLAGPVIVAGPCWAAWWWLAGQ
jgi:hypothetical protein